ncbi:MAG: hypothetical protein ACPGU4_02475 [Flavobacteriales bacterium]
MWRNFLLVSCLIGLALRIEIILQPAETILARYGSDDLFYYTEITKNLVNGNGISFDGIHSTTGIQPLWMLLLLPFASLFENPEYALKTVLVLATFFCLITAVLMPKVLKNLLPKNGYAIGVIAGSIWILHPKILQVCFEGTEAALAGFAWLCSIRVWQTSQKTNQYYFLGIVLGLGVLARVDHLVLAAALWFFPLANAKSLLRKGLQMLPGVLLFLGGWLLVCWLTTGELAMDSGKIKRLHFLRMLALENDFPITEVSNFSLIFEQLKGWFQNGFRFATYLLHAESSVSFVLVTALLAALAAVVFKIKDKDTRLSQILPSTWEVLKKLSPLFFAAILIFCAYIIYLQHLRAWYLIPLFLGLAILCAALVLDLLLLKNQPNKRAIAVCVGLFVTLGALHVEANLKPRKGLDSNFFVAVDYVNNQLPPGSKIGAFNSGMAGTWLSPKHVVVNLDGVVNHGVVDAMENGQLSEYIQREKIEYLLDFEGSMKFFSTIGGGNFQNQFELVEQFPPSKSSKLSLNLWKRKAK